ncbi:MAG: PD40 domain-containing protein [Bacteroidetes bacterium]|nr:PD40 domain-containing protein [Bacteroidota bacterium]
MKRGLWLILVALCASMATAQLTVVSVERLSAGEMGGWSHPRFSPDGQRLYFTRFDFNGIWEYRFQDQSVRRITSDPRSGYGFAVSDDGTRMAYRRTIINQTSRRRVQEIVVANLIDGSEEMVTTGKDLSLPAFSGNTVVYSGALLDGSAGDRPSRQVSLIGIQDEKIALHAGGVTVLLDPLVGGRYIWPSLSPDGKRLVAVAMEGGAFVCDLQGTVHSMLGKRNAPAWTREGQWIIYMNDQDDGHQVTGSDIHFVSADGRESGQLTFTADLFEMYPRCSPVDNRIVCSTYQGDILLITYEEVLR